MALASLLESTIEIVAIALLIAAVDVYSVAAGPTKVIVEQHEQVLNAFTLAFHPLGSDGVAQIGSSDFVFFALFLAAAARLHLRIALTWSAMTLSFGLTLVLSYVFDAALPALPLLSLGFLAANGDLLLARFGGRGGFTRTGVSALPVGADASCNALPRRLPRRASRPTRRRSGMPARAGLGKPGGRRHYRHRHRHPARLGHPGQRRGRPARRHPDGVLGVARLARPGLAGTAARRPAKPGKPELPALAVAVRLPRAVRTRPGRGRRDRAVAAVAGVRRAQRPAQPAVRDGRRHGVPGRARVRGQRGDLPAGRQARGGAVQRPAHPQGAGRLGDRHHRAGRRDEPRPPALRPARAAADRQVGRPVLALVG